MAGISPTGEHVLPGMSMVTGQLPQPDEPGYDTDSSLKLAFSHKGQDAVLEIGFSQPFSHSAQGTLYTAEISAGNLQVKAAVKVFPYVVTIQQQRRIVKQVDVWSALDHPNVLPVFGICTFAIMQMGLVTPWIQLGNLSEFLEQFPDERRLTLLGQAVSGLEYLHDAGIVHGNLKCANVLISDSRTALLADFGWSMLVEQAGERTAVNIRARKTAAFEAPELLSSARHAGGPAERSSTPWTLQRTTSSDCFAVGMVIYETYAGHLPWADVPRHEQVVKVLAGEHPPRDYDGDRAVAMSDGLWELCTRCWSHNPSDRPRASVIHSDLSALDELSMRPPNTAPD